MEMKSLEELIKVLRYRYYTIRDEKVK